VLVSAETGDDAGVFVIDGLGLVATADFIPPVCDDPARFGRIAAANSLSDIWAMGGEPLFALNLCCFPTDDLPEDIPRDILRGGAEAMHEAGAALLGGHSVRDPELKFGLAVIGRVDPRRMLLNSHARLGEKLLLTKRLGTGVLVNAFKADKLDEEGLEPALAQMERLNATAARLALEHDVRAATDVTGYGLVGHALNLARNSQLRLRIALDALPVYDAFAGLVGRNVTTGCTVANRTSSEPMLTRTRRLDAAQEELLFDPQTSGGLLLSVPAERAAALLAALRETGHDAAEIGESIAGEPGVEII
jgi:selenide,water dikinase